MVRLVIAVVGGRVPSNPVGPGRHGVMPRQLRHTLTSMLESLAPDEVATLYDVARHRTTWNQARRLSSTTIAEVRRTLRRVRRDNDAHDTAPSTG